MLPVLRGKQKFEILTIQFPLCSSSSTLQTRILRFWSTYRPRHFQSYSTRWQWPKWIKCWGVLASTPFLTRLYPGKEFLRSWLGVSKLWVALQKTYDFLLTQKNAPHMINEVATFGAFIEFILVWGKGEYPSLDPWGNSFSENHDLHRFHIAGTKIGYFGILEGIQYDQDYLRILLNLRVGPSRQFCCYYCDAIQRVSNRAPIRPQNNPESLYTVFGPREGDTTTPNLSFSIYLFQCEKHLYQIWTD